MIPPRPSGRTVLQRPRTDGLVPASPQWPDGLRPCSWRPRILGLVAEVVESICLPPALIVLLGLMAIASGLWRRSPRTPGRLYDGNMWWKPV